MALIMILFIFIIFVFGGVWVMFFDGLCCLELELVGVLALGQAELGIEVIAKLRGLLDNGEHASVHSLLVGLS